MYKSFIYGRLTTFALGVRRYVDDQLLDEPPSYVVEWCFEFGWWFIGIRYWR